MKQKPNEQQKHTKRDIHTLLCEKLLSQEYGDGVYAGDDFRKQAEFCPYYVPLTGELGLDWGVITNPASPRFGRVVFEHDGCECPTHEK